jgi:hypothetical protein
MDIYDKIVYKSGKNKKENDKQSKKGKIFTLLGKLYLKRINKNIKHLIK